MIETPRMFARISIRAGDPRRGVRREQSTPTDPWMRSTNTYSTRYSIVDVASRLGGDELYVAGILPNDKSVIERWKFPKKKGRLVLSMASPAPPIGTAAGPWSASLALHGSALTMTPLPATWYAPDITVLMESSDYGFIRAIEVDPEGRFLLFNRYPEGDVYSIDLSQSTPTPAILFSAAQHPELAQAGNLQIAQHTTLGRVCIAAPAQLGPAMLLSPRPEVLFFVDSNNDAVFESSQSVPLDVYQSSRLLIPSTPFQWSWPWKIGP